MIYISDKKQEYIGQKWTAITHGGQELKNQDYTRILHIILQNSTIQYAVSAKRKRCGVITHYGITVGQYA